MGQIDYQIAKDVKTSRERLRLAPESGLSVIARDAPFWFRCQRIITSEADVFDTLTETACRGPVYRCGGV